MVLPPLMEAIVAEPRRPCTPARRTCGGKPGWTTAFRSKGRFAWVFNGKRRGKWRLRRKNSQEFQSKAIACAVADDAGDP